MRKLFKIVRQVLVIITTIILTFFILTIIFPITRQAYFYYVGSRLTYYGFNEIGPQIAGLSIKDTSFVFSEQFRSFSVQNTKNGNYNIAIDALEEAIKRKASIKEYYGWVLLYYYKEYQKSYKMLDEYDMLTPNFSDPVIGENVNYLKGLALLKMDSNQKAIKEFDIYIDYVTLSVGQDWVDVYAFVNKGSSYFELKEYQNAINSCNLAIKHYKNCSEAYYLKSKSFLELNLLDSALSNAQKANNLILNNFKHEDIYVEYFHEIYPSQVMRLINDIEKKMINKEVD